MPENGRYMFPLERCAAICPQPAAEARKTVEDGQRLLAIGLQRSTPAGVFICIDGRFFGSSGCLQQENGGTKRSRRGFSSYVFSISSRLPVRSLLQAESSQWRGPLLATAMRAGHMLRCPHDSSEAAACTEMESESPWTEQVLVVLKGVIAHGRVASCKADQLCPPAGSFPSSLISLSSLGPLSFLAELLALRRGTLCVCARVHVCFGYFGCGLPRPLSSLVSVLLRACNFAVFCSIIPH